MKATIDLTAPYDARCLHDGGEAVLYRVRQARQNVWLAIPVDGDGSIVAALGLPWPPPTPSPFRYL